MSEDDHRTRRLGPVRPGVAPEERHGAFDVGDTLPVDVPAAAAGGPSSPALRIGTRLGRYLLEEEIGRGGMGVVYAALDPELDRRIAIKVLRTSAAEGSAGRTRLLREAQALARLAHPNVIAVFDVGVVSAAGDEIFVAMELCTGGTLRQHQAGKSWRDIVLAYVHAGRGLAAAHEAGLVHRDFKPDNVLVGADGRLRVTDFGLVRAAGDVVPAGEAPAPAKADPLSSDLTAHGSVVGTPMFMAPEQMTGAPVEAAADQFSFCVALWQALHGEPPYLGAELAERISEIQAGRRREPRNRQVPARVNRALARGLAAVPSARWPRLSALLDELEAATRSRAPWLVGGTVVAAGAALTTWFLLQGGAGDPCRTAGNAGAGLWTARRETVAAAFRATGAPFAGVSFTAIDRRLSGLETAWRAGAIAACQDTRVRGLQSPALLDQRMACLASRRHRIAAIVDELARADRALLERLHYVLAGLPRVEDCADTEVLAGKAARPTNSAQVAALADLERRVAELDARMDLRRSVDRDRVREAADGLVEEARRLDYVPVAAGALIARAAVREQLGDAAGARKDLIDAAAAATRGGDRDALATAYLELLYLDTTIRGDLTGAEQWSELAAAAVDAIGRPPDKRGELAELRAELIRAKGDPAAAAALLEAAVADPELDRDRQLGLRADLARLVTDLGDYDRAERLFAELIPETGEVLGSDHTRVLGLRYNRANLLFHRGDFAACIAAHGEVLAARERAHGEKSPQVAASLQALGVCENKAGRNQAAREHLERSVALSRDLRGPEHLDTLAALSDLAGAYSHGGDHARSEEINRELLAIRERTLGPDHPDTAVTMVNLAIEIKNAGRPAEAIGLQQRAVASFEKALGRDHPNVGIALINLGETMRAAGRPVEAIAVFERAGTLLTKGLGAEHVVLTHVWYGLGQAELARGRVRAALPWLERAVAGRSEAGTEPNERAEAQLALARALIAGGGDRQRARKLAEDAIAAWRQLGEHFDDERRGAETWLATLR